MEYKNIDEFISNNEQLLDTIAEVEATEKGYAKRYNSDKLDFTLIPVAAEEEEAKVWAHGAHKYGRDNWRKLWGVHTPLVCIASILRHVKAMQEGEFYDAESNLPHAAHVRCNSAMIIEYLRRQQKDLTEGFKND